MKLKKVLAAITAVSLAVSAISAAGIAVSAEDEAQPVYTEEITDETPDSVIADAPVPVEYAEEYTADVLPDSAELEELYLGQLFYGDYGISTYKDYGASHLSGNQLDIYNFLKAKIEGVANGSITITKFTYTPRTPYNNSASFYADADAAVDCIMVDLPASFYWYDKVTGLSRGVSGYTSNGVTTYDECEFIFQVSDNYVKTGGETETVNFSNGTSKTYNIEVNSAKIASARTAVANAQSIITANAGKTAYEKIVAYNNAICNLTSYNDAAADDSTNTPYGDPWQLVYVFDNNSSTNVVCEGYSKAFQYLCDLGGVDCYTVTGTMSGGTGAGPHMWNIVSLGGKSYLVDVTNCDAGNIGAPDQLLLKGAASSTANGCTMSCRGGSVVYTYDSDTKSLYSASILTVSTTDYDPESAGGDEPVVEFRYYVSVSDVDITVGETKQNSASGMYYDAAADAMRTFDPDAFIWSVENTSVATVDQSGLITAVAAGTTRGKVRYEDARLPNGYIEEYFNITVRAASSSTPEDPTNPSNPSTPSDPTNPSNPSTPSDPTNPSNPSTPSNPTRPEEPSTPSNPTKPGEPSAPSNPTRPEEPSTPDEPSNPSGSTSASASTSTSSTNPAPVSSTTVADTILAIPDSGNGSITLGSSTKLDKTVMETLAEKDTVTVTFNVAGGAYWEISGEDVTDAKAVDLGVKINGTLIPESKVTEFAGDKTTVQLTLRHNGDFGFTGTLYVPVGKANNGKFANLYYYHGGKFDFVGSSAISGGMTKFVFSHASNYLIVIDDYAYGEDVSSAAGMTETTEASAFPYVAALVVIAAFGTSAVVLKKRLSK